MLWERVYNDERYRWCAAKPVAAIPAIGNVDGQEGLAGVAAQLLLAALRHDILNSELHAFHEVTEDGLLDDNQLWEMAYELWPEEMKDSEI